MENFVIGVIIAILMFIGINYVKKHFRHESGCCGGGIYKAKKKRLSHVIARKTFNVSGMTCEHCVNRVQEAINSIDGASGVVNLRKGTVTVSMSREISDEDIIGVIEKAGYEV